MAPAKYGDLGKKAGDILRKDFFIQHRLVQNSTLKGVEVQTTLCTGGQRTSSLYLFKAWPRKGVKVKAYLLSDLAFRSYLVVKNSTLVSGLNLTATVPLWRMLKYCVSDLKSSCVVFDSVFPAGPATLGIKTKLRGNGTLSGTEAAVEYTASNTSVFAQYNVDNKRSSVSLHSSITSALDVAMEVYFSPLNAYWRRSLDFTLALGALYKVDDASSIKGKVARSMVKLCYTRKARENLAMQVTAAIDISNVTSSHHKWGVNVIWGERKKNE